MLEELDLPLVPSLACSTIEIACRDAGKLLDVLAPFAEAGGMWFVDYQCDDTVGSVQEDRDNIEAHADLLQALQAASSI